VRRNVLTILVLLAVFWAVLWVAVLAHAAQPEGAMGTLPLPDVVSQMGPFIKNEQAEILNTQEFFYRVTKESSFDFKGIQFFHLKSSEGTATISVDGDVALSSALAALDGQRVRLTLEPATLVLKKVER
jgi:hypothetical protein